jgi:hypothetical protein
MESRIIVLNKKKLVTIIYWLLPVALFFFQLVFSIKSTNQIRYEELAESVRNVFWLQNRIIYDGISSNIGWYGTLLILYKLFGFSLFSTKFFRLILHLFSLISLAAVLKKYIGVKKASIPLIAFGLSPTLIYLNILQTSYGIDLQYLPFSLFLLMLLNESKNKFSIIFLTIAFWILNMWVYMSYPTYLFYLPSFFVVYLYILRIKQGISTPKVSFIMLSFTAFMTPLIIGYIYVKNRNLLIYDPIEKSGIFRGAGSVTFNFNVFMNNAFHTLSDMFFTGNSYYFEYIKGDLSDIFPIASLILIIILSIIILRKNRKYSKLILLIFGSFFFSTILSGFTFDPTTHPGIRRNTVFIAILYSLFIISYNFVRSYKWKKNNLKTILTVVLFLLPIHHIFVFPYNLISLEKPSRYKENKWFDISGNPAKSLNFLVNKLLQKDLSLSCQNNEGKISFCRYSEVYAALEGFCTWNHIKGNNIFGFDSKSEKYIPLSTSLWQNYYWSH